MSATVEDLIVVNDIGEVIANNIYEFFRDEKQLNLINQLFNIGLIINYPIQTLKTNQTFTNKIIVLTGDLKNYKRSELTTILEGFGAKVTSSVSSKTDLVIVGENAGSKFNKAQSLGIKIMYEDELINCLK